jgi:hypothetical protein
MKNLCVTIASGLLLVSVTAQADFFCGTHIIEQGMHVEQVIQHCGEPTYREDNRLVYDLGEGFLKVLHIQDGKVSYIEEEPRE